MAKKRKGVHPLVSAATLAPVALGLLGTPAAKDTATPTAPTMTVRHRPTRGGGGGAPSGEGFADACILPFSSIEQHHPIDDSCSVTGNASTQPAADQNTAKNNFCATGTPATITFDQLRQLQADAAAAGSGITFGGESQLPRDRTVLRNLSAGGSQFSEGEVVRIAAFVINAHGSNLKGGESVNCNQDGAESNDIHIVLGENGPNDDQCTSVTAEMSPHARPLVWTPDAMNTHNAHLFRFTGQLFFDASHKPCSGGKGSPARSSLWEIHPVYAVDICMDTRNNCAVNSDQNWISLAEEEGQNPNETRLRAPEDRHRNSLSDALLFR